MINKIKIRLNQLGYTPNDEVDYPLIALMYSKVVSRICHACNIAEIPIGCMEVEIVDAVCGEFLTEKKVTGKLTDVEQEAVVKAITEGDTKVEFAVNPTDINSTFFSYMKQLTVIDPNVLSKHRKLVW